MKDESKSDGIAIQPAPKRPPWRASQVLAVLAIWLLAMGLSAGAVMLGLEAGFPMS